MGCCSRSEDIFTVWSEEGMQRNLFEPDADLYSELASPFHCVWFSHETTHAPG